MPQEVMLYHSGMQGAPSATMNVLGGLIAVLDGCLVDGFNVNAISTLTQSGGVATATTSGTNGYAVGEWVDVSGAAQAEYNGRVQVTGKPAVNQFTYAVAGSPATPATGTITSKYGAAGWTKPFAGTNTAVYTSGAGSLGHSLQVEDTDPYADANASARTRVVVGASGIPDSGSQLGTQHRFSKLNTGWVLVADHKTCYLVLGAAQTLVFGEFASYLTGDLYAWIHNVSWAPAQTVAIGTATGGVGVSSVQFNHWFPSFARANNGTVLARVLRASSQLPTEVAAFPVLPGQTTASLGSGGVSSRFDQLIGMPNTPDASVPLTPILLGTDDTLLELRGRLRGAWWPAGQMPAGTFSANNVLRLDDVTIDGTLRKIALCRFGYSTQSQIGFDLGPTWG